MRRYYLCPIIGTGKAEPEDCFRPRVAEYALSWGMIDLRPNPTRQEGFVIAYADTDLSINDRQIQLLSEELNIPLSKNLIDSIDSTFKFTLEKQKLPDILAEILIDRATIQTNLCRPIRRMSDGKYRISLGGQIWGDPKPTYGHRTITEDFNRDDEALEASANWGVFETQGESGGSWDIVSNIAVTAPYDWIVGRHNTAMSTDDHYAQVDIVKVAEERIQLGVVVRFPSGVSPADTYYRSRAKYDASAHVYRIQEVTTGSESTLAQGAAEPADSDVMKLTVDGSDLELFINDLSHLDTTDSSITGELYTGIVGKSDTTPGASVDDFEADDLGAPPAGWTGGDVNGVAIATIAKINGVAVADITKVNGVA